MPIQQGRCTNFQNCDNADSHKVISIPQGADFVCPICGRALSELKARKSSGIDPKILAAVAVVLVVSFAGWGIYKLINGRTAGPHGEAHTILRLAGSNTIGASLGPALATAFLKELGSTDVHTVPGKKADEKSVIGTLPDEPSPVEIDIAAHGSDTGFTAMQDGSADIGMSSRRIKPEEAQSLASLGDMYSGSCEHVLGLDGIAVIVNAANPVNSLTTDQIQSLFTEDGVNWAGVGGVGGSVKVYARDNKSGTYDTFKSLVLKTKALTGGAKRIEDSNALSEAVAGDPQSIGFVGLPYIHEAKAVSVAEKGARAFQPTPITVQTLSYPLSRSLYLYSPAVPTNKYSRGFIKFALSNPGQEIVKQSGFADQIAKPIYQKVPEGAPPYYRALTEGKGRLPYDFRFLSGKYELESNSMVDIQRVVDFIASMKYSGDDVMLFGFTDNVGSASKNKELSEKRAKAVEDEFIQRGIKPSVVQGFGADLPVASNDSEEGKGKNRRVEIWVRR